MIHAMNPFTITADDRDATLGFYCGLLGLVDGPRPPFDFPGAWLYAPGGGQAILHIVFGRPLPTPRTGVIDHMAFTATDLPAVKARLDAAGGLLSRQVVGAQQADLYPETFVARKSDPRCWCQQELAGLSL